MPRRNTPNRVDGLDELSHLDEWVYDKRSTQRASVKKNRRNRHYEKLFMRHVVARHSNTASRTTDGTADEANSSSSES